MDLKSFLDLEREYLTAERERLTARYSDNDSNIKSLSDRGQQLHLSDIRNNNDITKDIHEPINNTYGHTRNYISDQVALDVTPCSSLAYDRGERNENLKTNFIKSETKLKEKNDMDQWISDTFYSHFPGFNNEYQKRQLYLQKRQQENQENLLKHQLLNARNGIKPKFKRNREDPVLNASIETAASNNSVNSQAKTPLISSRDESSSSARSGSSRDKLLQDLCHTNLANMINRTNDDELEWKRRQAELESARKKQYQQELMQQIEEKRRTIELLKDKEIQQEQVLTRRLEEQLKTMKLEEKLEKERLKATKIRYNAEQNHLLREHLLSKLENDSKLLQDKARAKINVDSEFNKENLTLNSDKKVYRYFSNSGKHEYNYRKKSSIPAAIDLTEDSSIDLPKIEKECFHLSDKICPSCDEPLKEFDEFCLRCQAKSHSALSTEAQLEKVLFKNIQGKSKLMEDEDFRCLALERGRSFNLACIKCERIYNLCPKCLKQSDVCKACQNKRNVCMNCRSSLCSFCLEEIACGKDTEKLHVNEREPGPQQPMEDTPKDEYVQEVSVKGQADSTVSNQSVPLSLQPQNSKYLPINNLNFYKNTKAPLSPNNGRVSIYPDSNNESNTRDTEYHYRDYSLFPNNGRVSLYHPTNNSINSQDSEHFNSFSSNDNNKDFEHLDELNIEKLRRDTDLRLTRYLKNYSELAYQSRGTQTTPNSSARRDIVLSGEQSLSIPLLREMPRMTRKETTQTKRIYSEDIENLKRRWEIPAVQKQTVSRTSPRVITQIGAVRRQLQTETFFPDDIV